MTDPIHTLLHPPSPWRWLPVGPDCYDLVTLSGNVRAVIEREGTGWRPRVVGDARMQWTADLPASVVLLRGRLGADVPEVST